MNKIAKFTLIAALMGAGAVQANVIELVGAASTTNLSESAKFTSSHVNAGWVQRLSSKPNPGDWAIATDGSLLKTGGAGVSESGAYLLQGVSVTDASLTKIEVSFSYDVAASTELYVYANAYTGDFTGDGNIGNMTAQDGTVYNQTFNSLYATSVNLLDGTTPVGLTTDEALVNDAGTAALTGVGTFSMTYDIADITDITAVMAAFGVDGEGAIEISNFTITAIPEPATIGMLGFGAVVTLMVRKKTRG